MIDPRIESEIMSSPVELLFISAGDPLSWCIRAASNFSPISHAGLAVGAHGQWLLHAIESGVRLELLESFLAGTKSTVVARFRVLPDVRAGVGRGLSLVGRPYDLREVGLRALALFSPFVALRRWWPVRRDTFTCGRFVRLMIGEAIPEWWRLPTWILPQDLFAHVGPSFVSS